MTSLMALSVCLCVCLSWSVCAFVVTGSNAMRRREVNVNMSSQQPVVNVQPMFGESLNNLSSSPGRKPAVNSSGRFVLRVCLTNVHVGVQLFALSGTQLSVNYVSASRWESWSLVPFLSCLRQSGCSSYKVRMTGAPSYLSQHLVQHVATRQTRSTALPLLTIPRTNTEFARRSYSYSVPFIWNSLPGDVLNCNSEHTFKKHLKTFLFNSCFYAAWLTPPLVPL